MTRLPPGMQVGIDSYCYHRLLGEIRPGESDPGGRFARGSLDVVAEALRLGVDLVALETCFLPAPGRPLARTVAAAGEGLELALSWGHPDGLEYGLRTEPLDDLLAWIAAAPAFGCRLVRMVVASPRVARPSEALELTARALATAAAAQEVGVELVVENHADLTAAELERLLSHVGSPCLGVCLDTANALRVGDDPLAAARRLAPHTRLVHLKDVAGGEADAGAGPRSVRFGDGEVALEEILRALWSAGYAGAVCVELGHLGPGEVDERELVADGVAWLRSALARGPRGSAS